MCGRSLRRCAAKDSAIAASSNITFIALTATPKAKTLRLFGEQDEDGNWRAFDTYTMAQAIEEGFILDVLTNYSTYDMFLRVKNELDNSEEEPLVDTGHSVTAIVQCARLHPTAIAQKVWVVVEHFRRNVKPLLTGNARAMVVTSSRREAYRWFEAMNSYIDTQGYTDIRPLVAMYVDKKLSGIAAVQTLSRLNRTYPGKTAPMVVDFQNTPASIQDDFKMYYSDARVVGEVDPNSLITIAERLDTAGIYTMQEMAAVADAYLSDAGDEAIAQAMGPIKERWQAAWTRTPEQGRGTQGLAARLPRRHDQLPQRLAVPQPNRRLPGPGPAQTCHRGHPPVAQPAHGWQPVR